MLRGTEHIVDPFDLGFSADSALSKSLPAQFYTDPSMFDREREQIFFRSWIFVGHVSDVAAVGDYFTTSVFDQSVVVVRGNKGEISAFYNVCRHRGHDLLCDAGRVARITCPYHAWTYTLDGTLVGVRNADQVSQFSKDD